MKTLLLTLVSVCTLGSLFAQGSCTTYFPFKEGAKLEYTYYDKKGKEEGRSMQEVVRMNKVSDNLIEAELKTAMYDKKGNETFSGSYNVRCEDGTFVMDMSAMIPQASMQAMGGAEAEMSMTGDGFRLPSNPKVGQEFPDSENVIEFMTGPINMKITMNLTNQKVEAKESLTTDAGTFDCFKFSYDSFTKMMMVKSQMKTVNWYAEGVGTVKSESYDKKGKLESSMVLTKFEE